MDHVSQPVLVNCFPAIFCLIHDFPHLLLAALTPSVPGSDDKLCRCRLLWLRLRSNGPAGESVVRWEQGRLDGPQHPRWRMGLPAQPGCRGLPASDPGELFTGLCKTATGSTGSCLEPCLHEHSCCFYQRQSRTGIFLA